MVDYNLDEMAKQSGEENIKSAPRYELPTIRLQGKKGKFIKKWRDENKEYQSEEIGETLEGVMLKVRRKFSGFGKDEKFFTNEHNSWKDTVNVFYVDFKVKDKKTQLIDTGKISDLRVKYPNLKMRQVIYFLMDGEIVKLEVKGKGLSNLFDYWKEQFESSEHIFQFITKVSISEKSSPLGSYYAMNFEKGREIKDLTEVGEKLNEVTTNIEKIDSYYIEQVPSYEIEEPENEEKPKKFRPDVKDEDIPVVEEEKEDEVDVKDIPF